MAAPARSPSFLHILSVRSKTYGLDRIRSDRWLRFQRSSDGLGSLKVGVFMSWITRKKTNPLQKHLFLPCSDSSSTASKPYPFPMDSAQNYNLPSQIHIVTSSTCSEFTHLLHSLRRSTVVGLDAEWKPRRSTQPNSSPFPPVTLLQIACQFQAEQSDGGPKSEVFLVDLLGVPLGEVYQPIKDMFESETILKLGFRFKQDLVYLSHTFSTQGCDAGFDMVLLLSLSCLFD